MVVMVLHNNQQTSSWSMVAGEDTSESYSKVGVDWILKKSLLAIELLITGTVFQIGP